MVQRVEETGVVGVLGKELEAAVGVTSVIDIHALVVLGLLVISVLDLARMALVVRRELRSTPHVLPRRGRRKTSVLPRSLIYKLVIIMLLLLLHRELLLLLVVDHIIRLPPLIVHKI